MQNYWQGTIILLSIHIFHGEKKEELLGVAANRIMRMNLANGDHIKTWRYSTMKAWNVNWETRHMMIQFEDDKNVIFQVICSKLNYLLLSRLIFFSAYLQTAK